MGGFKSVLSYTKCFIINTEVKEVKRIVYFPSYKKYCEKAEKEGYKLSDLNDLIELLALDKELSKKHHDHPSKILPESDFRNCTIKGCWQLNYKKKTIRGKDMLILFSAPIASIETLF